MQRHRRLSEQDQAVWESYTALLRPLPGREAAPSSPKPGAPVAVGAVAVAALPPVQARVEWLTIGQAPAGIDKATWLRFRSGRLSVGRRLDLHGLTAQRAFDRFEQVLHATATQGLRCIEVITGRGAGESGGVLRRELPLWLNLPHLRPLILGAAHPHAANDGAVRLLLRRQRG